MVSMKLTRLQPAGIYSGVFDGFQVLANKHLQPDQTTVWHVRSFRNDGDLLPHRDHWIVGEDFRTVENTYLDHDGMSFDISDRPILVEERERRAILKALSQWSYLEQ